SQPRPIELEVVDLRHLGSSEVEEYVRQLARDEEQRPFDLEVGPLLRVSLLQLGAEDYVLSCTMHHIVSDEWSLNLLTHELGALYESYTQATVSELPDLPVQYVDYAVWQREWLQGEALEQQLAYWKRQLSDLPPVLKLPSDHPGPPVQSYRGA